VICRGVIEPLIHFLNSAAAVSLAAVLLVCGSPQDASAQSSCGPGRTPPLFHQGPPPNGKVRVAFSVTVPGLLQEGTIQAINLWNPALAFVQSGIRFEENPNEPNIYVTMAPPEFFGNPTDGAFWQPDNVDGFGRVIRATIYLNSNTAILDSREGAKAFLLHEFGHHLGLDDTSAPGGTSVMNSYSGKNDSNGNIRHAGPSICDATAAAAAQYFTVAQAGIQYGLCPGGLCSGYSPFPPPCPLYDNGSGWCGDGSTTPESFPAGMPPPTLIIPPGIQIVSPANGATVSGSVPFQVASGDSDGRVMMVRYYVNGQIAFTTIAHPFAWSPSTAGLTPGQYTVQAQAIDNQGLSAWSNQIVLNIVPGGGGGGSGVLASGHRLYANQRLYSPNGAFYLTHQADGNLVLYGPGGAYWASMAFSAGGYTEMQGDGNLVSYGPGAYWATMTFAPGATLSVQNDGNIVIYSQGWAVCGVNSLQPGEYCP
jgi:Bacterial Ig domain